MENNSTIYENGNVAKESKINSKSSSSAYSRDCGVRRGADFDRDSGYLFKISGGLFIGVKTYTGVPKQFISGKRSNITCFTASSGQRMRRYLRSCISSYTHMVTLTYPCGYPSNGAIVKEHLRRFNQELKRQELRQRNSSDQEFSVFWFLEFQERGAPHFHLFTTCEFSKKFVSQTWYKIVNSEDPRHLAAGTRVEKLHAGRNGTISYASKYAAKAEQKTVPQEYSNVGRFWGVSGNRIVVAASTWVKLGSMQDERVKSITKSMKTVVEVAIQGGKAVQLFHNPGEVSVVSINCPKVIIKLRVLLARLTAFTMLYDNMFSDCEVDP